MIFVMYDMAERVAQTLESTSQQERRDADPIDIRIRFVMIPTDLELCGSVQIQGTESGRHAFSLEPTTASGAKVADGSMLIASSG